MIIHFHWKTFKIKIPRFDWIQYTLSPQINFILQNTIPNLKTVFESVKLTQKNVYNTIYDTAQHFSLTSCSTLLQISDEWSYQSELCEWFFSHSGFWFCHHSRCVLYRPCSLCGTFDIFVFPCSCTIHMYSVLMCE